MRSPVQLKPQSKVILCIDDRCAVLPQLELERAFLR